jgi:hypothetical protein
VSFPESANRTNRRSYVSKASGPSEKQTDERPKEIGTGIERSPKK